LLFEDFLLGSDTPHSADGLLEKITIS